MHTVQVGVQYAYSSLVIVGETSQYIITVTVLNVETQYT